MLDKREKILIVGKSGSGKDYLLRQLESKGLKSSIKVTTRPKRENEINDLDYHFKSNNEFDLIKENNKMIVTQEFKNDKDELWKYGVLLEDFNKSQVFIMTPGELTQISIGIRKNCFIVYLDIDLNIRESRISNRNDSNDSIKRRLDADEIDFKDFKDYDLRITDPMFDVDTILSLMY